MKSPFLRIDSADVEIREEHLANMFAAPFPTPIWIVGGGPSLQQLDVDAIRNSPAPKFCINLSGRSKDGRPPLIRPDFWTAYDSTARFHRSIYMDPRIMKFVCRSRRMDLVPEGTEKVCQAPNVHFFDREYRGYANFLDPNSDALVDCQDSFIQAIDIAFRLGFRTMFLVGCELIIRPSEQQVYAAEQAGVEYDWWKGVTKLEKSRGALLRDFDNACIAKGMQRDALPGEDDHAGGRKRILLDLERPEHYSFSEQRKWTTTLACDEHYYKTTQWLRMARTNLALNGVNLISCTPLSRLNDYFPLLTVEEAVESIHRYVGNPEAETTEGSYESPGSVGENFMPMKDYRPHMWEEGAALPVSAIAKKTEDDRLKALRGEIPDEAIEIEEVA